MRSKMNWLSIVFCLLAVALVTQSASANVLNDPNEPGSVLVFPLYIQGYALSTDNGLAPLSSFEISVVCPNGAVCPTPGLDYTDVDIRAHWVCPTEVYPLASLQCEEHDFTLATTVNGTLRFDPNGNCSPQTPFGANIDTCGSIPPPPCERGYLIAWVVNAAGNPIKFDGLLGDAVLRQDGLDSPVTAYNAIPIQAGAALATGQCVNRTCGNSVLNFNGVSYKEVSNVAIASVHYDGYDDLGGSTDSGINSVTELVLLTLDIRSNLPNNPVEVGFEFYNEIEQGQSTNTQFWCTAEVRLEGDLGITADGVRGQKGLMEASASSVDIFGRVKPVTLLGLVITHEDSYHREYAYPLLDNSKGVATQFAP